MSGRILFTEENGPELFTTDRLVSSIGLDTFACPVVEYNE
jgi:hypothetical protein